jgi:hypothetical protein
MLPKVRYLYSLLRQYGYTDKYLVNTESALLCGSTGEEAVCQSDDFSDTKAAYIAQANTTAATLGLRLNLWYSLQGWRASELVQGHLHTLPAYDAYRFNASVLRQFAYQREITDYPNARAYELVRDDGERIWILWAQTESPQELSLPSQPTAVYDVLGNVISVGQWLSVTWSPVYVVW